MISTWTIIKFLRSKYLRRTLGSNVSGHLGIISIRNFQFADGLSNFSSISLKGNALTKLPMYLLNNALEKNPSASALYLSENPWRCECNFMSRFQVCNEWYISKDETENSFLHICAYVGAVAKTSSDYQRREWNSMYEDSPKWTQSFVSFSSGTKAEWRLHLIKWIHSWANWHTELCSCCTHHFYYSEITCRLLQLS